ncbi:zinc-ribbon domain-containing protein [[Clostridium] symbiosum]|jgi:predicted nucleic acid-binding Zn ribbon protein|nr:zinc-ribbon domain-containing protein [[Clostridium] symbiosum]
MGMFGKIKESIDKGIVSVSVKSSTYLEIEKLKTKVANVSGKMDMAASEMGAAVYSQWKNGSVNQEYIENVCRNIQAMEKEIQDYQVEIGRLEQEKTKILGGNGPETAYTQAGIICGCGCTNEAGARFCIRCGKPLEQTQNTEPPERVCPSCGMKAEPEAKFCMGCGKPLGE